MHELQAQPEQLALGAVVGAGVFDAECATDAMTARTKAATMTLNLFMFSS